MLNAVGMCLQNVWCKTRKQNEEFMCTVLQMEYRNDYCEKIKLRWFDYVERINENQIVKPYMKEK